MLECAITIDVDSLKSIFKGKDLKNPGDYNYLEYKLGIEIFLKLFREFNIKATFFVVGQDLEFEQNREIIKELHNEGHEIANHTMHHTQGFRFLDKTEKIKQLELSEEQIFNAIGEKPVGFRSPGWNINNEGLQILIERNYRYDSSVFPTYMMPLLKLLHFNSMKSRPAIDRTTMGQMDYMFASPLPYQTDGQNLRRKGKSKFYEYPVSVTPILRIPFSATFLLSTGLSLFKICYNMLKSFNRPIIYLFHLFDFVDFSQSEFVHQLPKANGIYLPASVKIPYEKKYEIFYKALSIIAKDYSFSTLKNLKV